MKRLAWTMAIVTISASAAIAQDKLAPPRQAPHQAPVQAPKQAAFQAPKQAAYQAPQQAPHQSPVDTWTTCD